jgi:hypothetical protein
MVAQEPRRRKRDPDGEELPIPRAGVSAQDRLVPLFMLSHHHAADECGAAFAAWKGFDSPLRHKPALASCVEGRHHAWWQVEAADAEAALAQLPPFVAARTDVEPAREVRVP